MRERVIEIQRLTTTAPDALGRPRTTWTTEAETFAAIGAQSGREFFDAPQITAQQRIVFRLRYRPGITVLDRIAWDGRLWDIHAVIDERGAHRWLQLHTTEIPQ